MHLKHEAHILCPWESLMRPPCRSNDFRGHFDLRLHSRALICQYRLVPEPEYIVSIGVWGEFWNDSPS